MYASAVIASAVAMLASGAAAQSTEWPAAESHNIDYPTAHKCDDKAYFEAKELCALHFKDVADVFVAKNLEVLAGDKESEDYARAKKQFGTVAKDGVRGPVDLEDAAAAEESIRQFFTRQIAKARFSCSGFTPAPMGMSLDRAIDESTVSNVISYVGATCYLAQQDGFTFYAGEGEAKSSHDVTGAVASNCNVDRAHQYARDCDIVGKEPLSYYCAADGSQQVSCRTSIRESKKEETLKTQQEEFSKTPCYDKDIVEAFDAECQKESKIVTGACFIGSEADKPDGIVAGDDGKSSAATVYRAKLTCVDPNSLQSSASTAAASALAVAAAVMMAVF